MQLSKRLQAVADMINQGHRVADIGCDHAYTAIYLIRNKISPYVVAMDINQGPLDIAKKNIDKYNLADSISTRKSDGLQKLRPGEVETIVIAGMGGRLIHQILVSKMDVVSSAKHLVLQPQSEIPFLRKALMELGYLIINEIMVEEDGKYYFIMKLRQDSLYQSDKKYHLVKPEHICFGRLLLEERNLILLKYMQTERRQYINIYKELEKQSTKQAVTRQKEIEDFIRLIDISIGYYKEDK